MKQQLVWQDMSEAPKDRQILVGIKSAVDGVVRFDAVEWDIEFFNSNLYEWYSLGSGNHYSSSDSISEKIRKPTKGLERNPNVSTYAWSTCIPNSLREGNSSFF